MKKSVFLLIGCLCLLTAGIVSVSCSDKGEGCTCTYTQNGADRAESFTFDELRADAAAAQKPLLISNCDDAKKELLKNLAGSPGSVYRDVKCTGF